MPLPSGFLVRGVFLCQLLDRRKQLRHQEFVDAVHDRGDGNGEEEGEEDQYKEREIWMQSKIGAGFIKCDPVRNKLDV
jgi:hypothetical protein